MCDAGTVSTASSRDDHERATSFEHGAREYRAARPSYPRQAAQWLTPGPGSRVLDLAAGTGKLTEVLHGLGTGLDLVAVEPSAAMRSELTDALPHVPCLAGTAESIPLPDADVDGVVVAQAWHWFSLGTAVPEIARVLRPGGRLGVVWNVRDTTVDWVEAFSGIIHRGDSAEPHFGPPALDEHFADLEHETFHWYQSLPRTELRTLAASRSHLLTLAPDARDELLDAVDELVATHPDLRDRETLVLPYRTECWRARRVG